MQIILKSMGYYLYDLTTKINVVKLYRNGISISFVCRRYIISKVSLMRWNKKYDGTKECLLYKSSTKHLSAHTELELYGKLRINKGCTSHVCSFFRFLDRKSTRLNSMPIQNSRMPSSA